MQQKHANLYSISLYPPIWKWPWLLEWWSRVWIPIHPVPSISRVHIVGQTDIGIDAHAPPAGAARDVTVVVPPPHLAHARVLILAVEERHAFEVGEHVRVGDVVHGADDGARVDGERGPLDDERGAHRDQHEYQDDGRNARADDR